MVAPPGAAPLYRADRLRELGGWEERYFLYFEDLDLALRALLRGGCSDEQIAAFRSRRLTRELVEAADLAEEFLTDAGLL